jgi:VWFA-related protein
MPTSHRIFLELFFSLSALLCAQQDNAPHSPVPNPEPDAKLQANPRDNAGEREGLMRIDVVVTDRAGQSVPGLKRADFSLLDNGQPRSIITFRAFQATTAKLNPPVSVILLIDTLDLPENIAAFERKQVEEFLRQNSGHLDQPVTLYSLDDTGLFRNSEPSLDGNALAEDVDSGTRGQALLVPPGALSHRNQVIVDPSYTRFAPLTALRALATIAATQDRKPGRKLILWVGPGLRADQAGTGRYPDRVYDQRTGLVSYDDLTDLQATFETIYGFSTLLRQARISLDSFSVGEDDFGQTHIRDPAQNAPGTDTTSDSLLIPDAWKLFVDGAPSDQQTSMMGLYRKVLAVQSGGRVLPPENALARQIASCVAEVDTFYTLTFDPPLAAHADEYHNLKVELSQPGLTARTRTGYYDEPFYNDSPNPFLRQVTVEQLEQILQAAHGKDGKAQQLSTLELTERLSDARLATLTRELHGSNARDALEQIADQSEFLPPHRSEVPADPPPDPAAQKQILALVTEYLDHTLPKLPNFFASRSAIRFGETAEYTGRKTIDPVSLHVEERSKAAVLYRHGAEVVDAAPTESTESQGRPLLTHGTFGPLLSMIRVEISAPGRLRWSRWQQGAGGRQAVFHFQVPASESHYQVDGCCLPDGDGTTRFEILPPTKPVSTISPLTTTTCPSAKHACCPASLGCPRKGPAGLGVRAHRTGSRP